MFELDQHNMFCRQVPRCIETGISAIDNAKAIRLLQMDAKMQLK